MCLYFLNFVPVAFEIESRIAVCCVLVEGNPQGVLAKLVQQRAANGTERSFEAWMQLEFAEDDGEDGLSNGF
jgi:hypothetical protein